MILSIFYLLLYIVLAVIFIEVIFWILGLIFAGFLITPRIRGLIYAVLLILVIIYGIEHFTALH